MALQCSPTIQLVRMWFCSLLEPWPPGTRIPPRLELAKRPAWPHTKPQPLMRVDKFADYFLLELHGKRLNRWHRQVALKNIQIILPLHKLTSCAGASHAASGGRAAIVMSHPDSNLCPTCLLYTSPSPRDRG
eukprot:1664681-Amphidinium_carterae.1